MSHTEHLSPQSADTESPRILITLKLPAEAAERLYALYQAGALHLPVDLGELINLEISSSDEETSET